MEESKQVKPMRILGVTQLKAIQVSEGGFVFPVSTNTRLILDRKSPSKKKEHQLLYQQGSIYGTVGDCCDYLSNDDLLNLESKGMIRIKKSNDNRKPPSSAM